MTAGLTLAAPPDGLATLREYRALAPWGLRDLAALAAGVLDASGVVPVNPQHGLRVPAEGAAAGKIVLRRGAASA